MGIWHLEKLLGYPEEVMEFQIWYLKEKGWIRKTETGKCEITVDGVDIPGAKRRRIGKSEDAALPRFFLFRRDEKLAGKRVGSYLIFPSFSSRLLAFSISCRAFWLFGSRATAFSHSIMAFSSFSSTKC